MSGAVAVEERLVEIERRLEAVIAENRRLAEEREEYRKLYLDALERCRKLELGILGQKRERLPANDAQLTLSFLETLLGDRSSGQAAPKTRRVRAHERRRPSGRRPLPEHLPRVEVEVIPPEVQKKGLDAFERIGEDVSETIEYRPSSLVVVRTRRPKFVERRGTGGTAVTSPVAQGAPPELPIARGLAGPGLLAHTIVARWQDHMPLHRQEKRFAREYQLDLARSTMCGWHEELAALARPLYLAMWEDAYCSPYLCVDATGVLVQAKERCRWGHFWVVVAPERHVLFAYSPRHDSAAVDKILSGYEGYLVLDAHAVYDHLFKEGGAIEVGCWSHCRRYYFKALTSDPERARQALAWIGALFQIERRLATAPRKKRERVRRAESAPIVETFFAWCDAEADRVLDDTPIARAIGYARNQREALCRFLEDGRLPIHNNFSELSLRREVIGRKNWLFVGSDQGAEPNVVFVTLLASCQLHQIEPWAYLRDLFCLLPDWPVSRVLELAPANWAETRNQEETRHRLAENVYRRICLGEDGPHRLVK